MQQDGASKKMTKVNISLYDDIASYYDDPLGFVMYAYPWDTNPSIQIVELQEPWASKYNCKYGPDKWACEMLEEIGIAVKERGFDGRNPVEPLRMAVTSGHGIGKSCITAWLVDWIMSTRPYAQGTVTANTGQQLETKTWAQVAKWTKICITAPWFVINTGRGSMKMYHKDYQESWYCSAQTCREENSESFAGQHAANSTSFYIFDEASAVPDKIQEVAKGGMTDGEPMMFAFGNPTRNTGWFRECFGKLKHRWIARQIDSRAVAITNKAELSKDIEDYGYDSDYVKVRIRGVFPSSSSLQFIDSDVVEAAIARHPECHLEDPLIMGVDVARFGDDQSIIAFRKGRDATIIDWEKHRKIDTMQLAARVAALYEQYHCDAVFVDEGGVGGGVIDRLRMLRVPVVGINFGSKPDYTYVGNETAKYANKRAEMWGNLKYWLPGGSIPDDNSLRDGLIAVEYGYNIDNAIQLEKKEDMRKRGLSSPDEADALALTFAFPVIKNNNAGRPGIQENHMYQSEYDPFA